MNLISFSVCDNIIPTCPGVLLPGDVPEKIMQSPFLLSPSGIAIPRPEYTLELLEQTTLDALYMYEVNPEQSKLISGLLVPHLYGTPICSKAFFTIESALSSPIFLAYGRLYQKTK